MTDLPVIVVSDVHLGAIPPDREFRFRSWLEAAASRTGHLVINGDLFDFWFEYGSVIPRGYTRTLAILARMVDSGIRIDFLGGNHDWWGGSFLENEIGVHFHQDPVRLELAGWTALVAHGDGLGQGDLGYRILRQTLRSKVARWGFRWIHPDVGALIARKVSRTRTRDLAPPPPSAERVKALDLWARDRLLEDDDLDLVLLGHTHQPQQREVGPGRYYFNSGDWIHHCTWIEIAPGEAPRLRALNEQDGPTP
ncbi:MAG: UDP-2,3-diacylglucosamine diphosphatase [Gemmatimonadales bacterium]|nr:MAG: UDP-2,3-diacylglucosamine diphosphatase [Gemmatimonadales bacterium]